MEKKSFALSVVMERVATGNRWQSERWQLAGVLPDSLPDDGSLPPARTLVDREGLLQKLYGGFAAAIFPDEAEGYFLNVTAPEPRLFVMWRMNEDETEALPHTVTLSYNEAARWMDAQEKVESVAMPDEIFTELVAWVEANYRPPEKKQRIRPKSFESKEGRYKGGLS
ncbi:MAG: DUF3305 domain-containing protein [Betaproteobacteria bacterium]|nr:DUF3305 domain-containing protein [Betaproteobacteria bacterium]